MTASDIRFKYGIRNIVAPPVLVCKQEGATKNDITIKGLYTAAHLFRSRSCPFRIKRLAIISVSSVPN